MPRRLTRDEEQVREFYREAAISRGFRNHRATLSQVYDYAAGVARDYEERTRNSLPDDEDC